MGSAPDVAKRSLEFMREAASYGDVTSWRLGPLRMVQANGPEAVRRVLVEDVDSYYKDDRTKQILGPVLGDGILISDGDLWKRQRKLVQPAFHARRIAAYADVMVSYANRMMSGWTPGQTIDMHQAMTRLTLDVVAKTLFDAEVGDDVEIIGEATHVIQVNSNVKFTSLFSLPDWVPTEANRRGRKAQAALDTIVRRFIDERRKFGEDRGDLLSMLLLAVDDEGSGMDDQQAMAEAMTLFLAGHDTTANTLTWAWYLLDQNPEVRSKLQAEIDTVLAGRDPTFEDLPKLTYTEMVIREVLRMYPAAWVTARKAIVDTTVGDFPIKKGTQIFISPYALHHDPRWFPEPDKFDPERFTEGWEDRIPRYGYIPFGGGPRVCIGNSFALMEARLILAAMAQRWQPSLPPGHVVESAPMVTLQPKDGLPMRLDARP
jgi:cytochrome P450